MAENLAQTGVLLRYQKIGQIGASKLDTPAVKFREITVERTGETSAQIRERVVTARRRQQERFAGKRNVTCSARMGTRELKAYCA